jgi:proline dehydrogenase
MINKIINLVLPLVPKPIVRHFAKTYIAGETLAEAMATSQKIKEAGARCSIDVLGEYVESKKQTLKDLKIRLAVIDKIKENNLDATESIKLTSLGLGLDDDFCWDNTKKIVAYARDKGVYVRIDMEDTPYTDRSLEIYRRLREEGFDNVGIVLQAYLKRTREDILSLLDLKPTIRLCKGIYVEPEELAFQRFDEINQNYKELLELMFENNLYACIATHDSELIEHAEKLILGKNISKDRYEFQMLLGVTEEKRDRLIKLGHPMRIYVSFGEDWYGYSMRRFAENPKIAKHVMRATIKSIFS